jgi:hypothetical protein
MNIVLFSPPIIPKQVKFTMEKTKFLPKNICQKTDKICPKNNSPYMIIKEGKKRAFSQAMRCK